MVLGKVAGQVLATFIFSQHPCHHNHYQVPHILELLKTSIIGSQATAIAEESPDEAASQA